MVRRDDIFRTVDWAAIGKRLLKHAIIRAGGRTLGQGRTPEDIVATVIEKTITGQRRYDPDKGPLVPWMKDQIDSELSNLYRAAATQRENPFPTDGTHIARHLQTPEAHTITAEQTERRWHMVHQAVGGDADLYALIEVVKRLGKCKPRDVADALGIPVTDVYNRLRRLRRRLRALEEETIR